MAPKVLPLVEKSLEYMYAKFPWNLSKIDYTAHQGADEAFNTKLSSKIDFLRAILHFDFASEGQWPLLRGSRARLRGRRTLVFFLENLCRFRTFYWLNPVCKVKFELLGELGPVPPPNTPCLWFTSFALLLNFSTSRSSSQCIFISLSTFSRWNIKKDFEEQGLHCHVTLHCLLRSA